MAGWLVVILLLILSSCMGGGYVATAPDDSGSEPAVSTPTEAPDTDSGAMPGDEWTDAMSDSRVVRVENVEVIVLESYPMQLHLSVTGYHPDGCEAPVKVEQLREADTVYVLIYRDMDADAICPAMIVPYEATIVLEGGFESGPYTIIVNDYTVEVTL